MSKAFFSNGAHFSQLSQSEDCESVAPNPTLLEMQQQYQLRTISLRVAIFLFFITFGASGLLGLYIGSSGIEITNKSTVERVSKYCEPTWSSNNWNLIVLIVEYAAPLLQDVDITLRPTQFNGSLLKENIYRQNASAEVDAAWEELGVDCPSIGPIE